MKPRFASMKFKSFARLFGKRSQSHSSKSQRAPRGRSDLRIEELEGRLLMATRPFVTAVNPPDGGINPNPNPSILVTFSEDMVQADVEDPAKYKLFDSHNTSITLGRPTYNSVLRQVSIPYQGIPLGQTGQFGLAADKYSLFIRGDHLRASDDQLAISPP